MSSNKKDLYEARHRLPSEGSVRTLDGTVWTAKHGGSHWFNDESNEPALTISKLAETHGPLIKVPPSRHARLPQTVNLSPGEATPRG